MTTYTCSARVGQLAIRGGGGGGGFKQVLQLIR